MGSLGYSGLLEWVTLDKLSENHYVRLFHIG